MDELFKNQNAEVEQLVNLINDFCVKSIKYIPIIEKKYLELIRDNKSTSEAVDFKKTINTMGIEILKMLLKNLYSIQILLSKRNDFLQVEHSIGIILRNNLSLCRIIFKFSELIQEKDSEKLKIFYRFIFLENIKQSINYIKKTCSEKEYKSKIDKIEKEYAFLFKELDIKISEVNEKDKVGTLNLNLSNQKLKSLETLFIYYSKYEHFGLNTLTLQSLQHDIHQIFEPINNSVYYSLRGIIICLCIFGIEDVELSAISNRSKGRIAP